jgi:Zn-dependent protease/CBS domain-containing protein
VALWPVVIPSFGENATIRPISVSNQYKIDVGGSSILKMRSWSISVGRILGIELRIHLTFLFLLIFVWLTESAAHAAANPYRGVALVCIIFASVVAHELGHALVARRAGIPAKAIILLPIGGVTLLDESRQHPEGRATWRRDIGIALAGPLVNLAIAGAAAFLLHTFLPGIRLWSKPLVYSGDLPRSLVWSNLSLGLFNLLPAYPMDGGRVLRALFSRKTDLVRATRRAVSIGQTLATVLMVAGMLEYVQGMGPAGAWLAMIGFFLLLAAQLEERSVVFQSVLETVRLEDVMLTEFATLSPADTLEDALDKAVHSLQDDFPVIRGGDMVGVISKQKILGALRSEGNGYIQPVMNRIFEVAQKQESLASAFRKLTSRNMSIIPVVEDQRLVGIVTLQNLMHSMALLAEGRKLRKEAVSP